MGNKQFEAITKIHRNFKTKLLRLLINKKLLITLSILILITVSELATDFIEIILGNIVELTNSYRPQSGTIWEQHHKDRLASEQLAEIIKSLPAEEQLPAIDDIMQLKNQLEQRQAVLITAEQFHEIYNQIPMGNASNIISPYDLLKLAHSRKWVWTKIVKNDSSLSFFFFDGDKQLLMDTYPPLSVLYTLPATDRSGSAELDAMDHFKGRTISREQFFAVFDDLPNSVKLQLINNPFLLVKWDRNIQKVGLSRFVEDGTVSLSFQVNQGSYAEVYTFQASDWAVDRFIEKLNSQYPGINFAYPEDSSRAIPEHF